MRMRRENLLAKVLFLLASQPDSCLHVQAMDELHQRQTVQPDSQACASGPLRWGSSLPTANNICCHSTDSAEPQHYLTTVTDFKAVLDAHRNEENEEGPITFYDVVTGHALFRAPKGRNWKEFVAESEHHGWPSFRNAEIVDVSTLTGEVKSGTQGEVSSTAGTHLGHNLPDSNGDRYCINLVCVAHVPPSASGGAASGTSGTTLANTKRDGLGRGEDDEASIECC